MFVSTLTVSVLTTDPPAAAAATAVEDTNDNHVISLSSPIFVWLHVCECVSLRPAWLQPSSTSVSVLSFSALFSTEFFKIGMFVSSPCSVLVPLAPLPNEKYHTEMLRFFFFFFYLLLITPEAVNLENHAKGKKTCVSNEKAFFCFLHWEKKNIPHSTFVNFPLA